MVRRPCNPSEPPQSPRVAATPLTTTIWRLSTTECVVTISPVDSKCTSHISPVATLLVIVAAYLVVGAFYAVLTPLWQVPDEPAHYNYIRSLATSQGLPVLESGDYDQALLSDLTSLGFPSELSIDPLEYEDHQPPLYYLLAVPVYRLFQGAVLPLRLFSVVLGAGVLFAAYLAVQSVFPDRPELALRTVAFIAFIPQHVAMMAGINNDVLGELVVALILWAAAVYVVRRSDRPWFIGILLGTALVSKTTAYPPLAAVFLAVGLRWWIERRKVSWILAQMGWLLVPAVVISAPWFIRNGITYGWSDPFGLVRHDMIVVGQPRSYDWLTMYGWGGLLSRLGQTTFHSFWGQFGWMGVVLPSPIYQLLALISVGLSAGFVWWLSDSRRQRLLRDQRICLGVFLAAGTLTTAAFVWYNLGFVQHQGRYLFPALVPLGLAVALSIDQWIALLRRLIHPWVRVSTFAVLAILALFDLYCLYRFVVPALTR